MNIEDGSSVIDQAAGLGTRMVQFIGGEPTLHRGLPDLVGHALGRGLQVEVFSNLVHVSPRLWDVFAQPGLQLATSYYADGADQHESITQGRGSYARTKANIAEAVRRSVPLRVRRRRLPRACRAPRQVCEQPAQFLTRRWLCCNTRCWRSATTGLVGGCSPWRRWFTQVGAALPSLIRDLPARRRRRRP